MPPGKGGPVGGRFRPARAGGHLARHLVFGRELPRVPCGETAAADVPLLIVGDRSPLTDTVTRCSTSTACPALDAAAMASLLIGYRVGKRCRRA